MIRIDLEYGDKIIRKILARLANKDVRYHFGVNGSLHVQIEFQSGHKWMERIEIKDWCVDCSYTLCPPRFEAGWIASRGFSIDWEGKAKNNLGDFNIKKSLQETIKHYSKIGCFTIEESKRIPNIFNSVLLSFKTNATQFIMEDE